MALSLGLGIGLTTGGAADMSPRVVLSSSSVLESAASGTTVGVLSVVNGTGSYTFTKTADPNSKFAVSGANLNTAAALDYETATSHSVTISASNGVDAAIVRTISVSVTNVFEAASLSDLTLSAASITQGAAATVNIVGATAGSTITGTVPDGMTLNSAARTITGTPTTVGSYSIILTETLADSANSPRASTVSLAVSAGGSTDYVRMRSGAGVGFTTMNNKVRPVMGGGYKEAV